MNNNEHNEQKLDLLTLMGDFWKIARKHLMLLALLVFISASCLTAYQKMNYHPVYEAYASFTVRNVNPLYSGVTGYDSKMAEVMTKTFPSIVNSNVLRKRVINDLQISSLPKISVSALGESSVITISVQAQEPQFAYDVLNSVVTYYPDVAKFVLGPTELELLDESGIPEQPINAFSLKSCLIKGGICGVTLWCVIIACLAVLRNTVHDEDELMRTLNMTCLGLLPDIKISSRQTCPLILNQSCPDSFDESVRLVRMRVEKSLAATGRKVLLVSSAIPGEGKTTISLNLAVALAQKGKRVLLIDCDLRNPSINKALKLGKTDSLVDYLKGRATVKDLILNTALENLFVISGGSGLKNSQTVILSHERTARLIQFAWNMFDYVILDTPPCSLLSDAAEIAELAECGLLVVRQDFAAKDQIMDGIQRLTDSNLPMIGCVFNGVRRTVADDYGYGYGYGYGYDYGYGNKK